MWTRLRLGLAALLGRTRFERARWPMSWRFTSRRVPRSGSGGGCRRRAAPPTGADRVGGVRSASRKRCGTSGSAGGCRCSCRISTTGFRVLRGPSRDHGHRRGVAGGSAWPSASTPSRASTPTFWRRSREPGIRMRSLPSTRGLSYPAFERIRELDDIIDAATAVPGVGAVQRRRRRRARRRARLRPPGLARVLRGAWRRARRRSPPCPRDRTGGLGAGSRRQRTVLEAPARCRSACRGEHAAGEREERDARRHSRGGDSGASSRRVRRRFLVPVAVGGGALAPELGRGTF